MPRKSINPRNLKVEKLYTEDELNAAIESAQLPLIETIDSLLLTIEELNELAISLGAKPGAPVDAR